MQTKKEQNLIYVAFPGMGKTTYALRHGGVIDLDFGNFRSAMGRRRDISDSAALKVPFSRLIRYYYQDGFNVFTNEYTLIPLIKQFAEGNIVMVLPSNIETHVRRVNARAKQNNRHEISFAKEMESNISTWVEDWSSFARVYKIPVKYVSLVEEALHDKEI